MFDFSDPALQMLVMKATAIFLRVALIIFFLPILGEDLTPRRVRVLMALALTACFLPLVPGPPPVFPRSTVGLVLMLAPELLLGLSMGLVARLTFAAIQVGGQMAGEQIGFGIANVIDPTNSAQISVPAQVYYIFSLMVFFLIDGHHLFFAAMLKSFELVEPMSISFNAGLFDLINERVMRMYAMSVVIAAPVMVAMLVSNLVLGLINKAVPQVNVFIESFPIRIALGLFIMAITFGALGSLFAEHVREMEHSLGRVLQLL